METFYPNQIPTLNIFSISNKKEIISVSEENRKNTLHSDKIIGQLLFYFYISTIVTFVATFYTISNRIDIEQYDLIIFNI